MADARDPKTISSEYRAERKAPQATEKKFTPLKPGQRVDLLQVPTWSRADMQFFLHGSLGTEVVPERVLAAFVMTYPDLFPDSDLATFGLIPDPSVSLPIGFSRREVKHLGGMSAVGINCASCHAGEIQSSEGQRVRVLGMTAHFDVETFFGAVIVATFRTQDPTNMERFLGHYFHACSPNANSATRASFDIALRKQRAQIAAAITEDPSGSKGVAAGALHILEPADLRLDRKLATSGDVTATVHALLKLFHNIRAALHVPDAPPAAAPLPNGGGRNDAWGLLSYALFGIATQPAPIKFGLVWNVDRRAWVHCDGNNNAPIIRNLAAALGLGAPMIEGRGYLDFRVVQRQTALSQKIRPPRYPWMIDLEVADRGAKIYGANCASCHDGPETDARLYSPAEIGTDANRAKLFDAQQRDLHNKLFTGVKVEGYTPPPTAPFRSTGKYWSPDLAGVWARAPYLHNGSVRTMDQLLTPSAAREKTWKRGTRVYDADAMGYVNEGSYVFDTSGAGNSNAGHDYGTNLSATEKRDLIEFLKSK